MQPQSEDGKLTAEAFSMIRKNARLSLREMADLLGISQVKLKQLESGQVPVSSAEWEQKLYASLPIEEFLAGESKDACGRRLRELRNCRKKLMRLCLSASPIAASESLADSHKASTTLRVVPLMTMPASAAFSSLLSKKHPAQMHMLFFDSSLGKVWDTRRLPLRMHSDSVLPVFPAWKRVSLR